MSENRLSHDATASTRGTLHQLWVAIEKCFEMHQQGQKILIETQGDVSGEDQIEVKLYSDNLTDNHLCFWKTLRNWVHDDFVPNQYKTLILLTTQQFGPNATISNWNNETTAKRMKIIQAIYDNNTQIYSEKLTKDKGASIPEPLKLQQYIFDEKRNNKLSAVLERFFIEAVAPNTPDLFERIKGQYLKGVMSGKKDDFLHALFGYISQPTNNSSMRWEITFEKFSVKVQELTGVYGHDTRIFPTVSINISDQDITEHKKSRLFVQKIVDIEYSEVIRKAVEHYHVAMNTVNNEFKTYSVPPQRTEQYSQDLIQQFESKHRHAVRNRKDIIRDSQNFYDEITGSSPQPFSGFDSTPLAFRNGLLHAEMDDDIKGLKWRVENDE